jgi:heme exporter protein A
MTLHVNQLYFERNDQCLLRDVNFTVHGGEVLQIAGTNGSGKTTLLRLLCGLLTPTSGTIQWCDQSINHSRAEYLSELIYCGHQAAVKNELTVYENLILFSALTKAPQKNSIEQALITVGLIEQQNHLAQILSAGQRRRLALAKLLLFKTKLWVLDEPFTALDQAGVALVESLLEQHVAQQGLAIITSHQALTLKNIKQQKLFLEKI